MKQLFLTTVMVGFFCLGYSQSNKEEVDLMQSVFGMEKKAMAAEFIKLEGAQKDAFWTAYDEYESKRKDLGKKRIDLLDKYVSTYTSLDDASTDQIIKDIINQQTDTDRLIVSYYNKIKKGSGIKAAAQFYQFEHYILSKVRAKILEGIPLIGEFDDK